GRPDGPALLRDLAPQVVAVVGVVRRDEPPAALVLGDLEQPQEDGLGQVAVPGHEPSHLVDPLLLVLRQPRAVLHRPPDHLPLHRRLLRVPHPQLSHLSSSPLSRSNRGGGGLKKRAKRSRLRR
ncbi:unnamed protein product, partial [Musa acuminata subsp. burmannicoides]